MNDYFCVLPFYGFEITHNNSKNIYCCSLQPGANIQAVRESMLAQQRPTDCVTCWKLEDQGLQSERQLHNMSFDFYLDRDLDKIEQDSQDHQFSTKIVKLATSNLCNGTCVTCNSHSSSAWAALEGQPVNYKTISPNIIGNINWKDIIQLSFVGGEPLLEKQNFEVLNKLIEVKNTKCFVSFVTNGSCEITQQQFQTLNQFQNLNICLSIDGIGAVFEYIRYPLKWDLLCQNLEQFKKITPNISVSTTISNVNIFYYTELIDFFESNQLNYLCKQVEVPGYFSPGNLPDSFKQLALDMNPRFKNQIQGFLKTGQYQNNKFYQCCQELRRQDALKQINISDYLPVNILQEL